MPLLHAVDDPVAQHEEHDGSLLAGSILNDITTQILVVGEQRHSESDTPYREGVERQSCRYTEPPDGLFICEHESSEEVDQIGSSREEYHDERDGVCLKPMTVNAEPVGDAVVDL